MEVSMAVIGNAFAIVSIQPEHRAKERSCRPLILCPKRRGSNASGYAQQKHRGDSSTT